ncbi:metal-dependent phosphohydrolase HD sub domain protein [Natrinema pellirubrum DSM 15624]|uniref:HD superfamily phosphohydrolase n=1 Tax=Natrinema pellirubrum (strain DSM 15624 / CIP 106293 / JCM 10476 / NCIMB 786 / 157) TaxID=797303 RepID=L0JL94_NATP1|nr:HD domain-containing protein [Natrinema pellirubrum]AGB31332.1 HD superfamily phosphohydrolase [Natrinema pellirubrum DSM 15624]ELY81733.1 metal-dependent phosphohydrolase HD sub domain protein [Natrinema pellirubrum DSM 15624]
MKTIKDSVHDHIRIDGVARDLLDTPALQRLRRISQLGTVSLVYPSANHTRFEHSLGVYHLACEALEQLGVEGREAQRVHAAAMLHDVGHGPFSHNLESLTHRRTGRYHDDVHDLLANGRVGAVLRSHGLEPDRVADLVAGEGRFGQLVSGELDVDRMDYLVRDAHHTGVPYGTIDHGRLVRELTFVDGELVLAEGNVQTAESLLVARALMNPTVYSHSVARIGKAMLRRAAERLLESPETDVDATTLQRMDDPDLLVALRSCPATSEFSRRLDQRDLFKRAVWAEMDDVPGGIIEADHGTIRAFEREISDRAGVDPERVILDVPSRPSMTESTSRVMVNGEIRRLDEQSPLVAALRASQYSQWRLGVYSPADLRDRVGRAAVDVLGLDIDGALVSEVRNGVDATLDQFVD